MNLEALKINDGKTFPFYFEAFDEKWKGGQHPAEVEKHWGVYRSDRTPKPAGEWIEER